MRSLARGSGVSYDKIRDIMRGKQESLRQDDAAALSGFLGIAPTMARDSTPQASFDAPPARIPERVQVPLYDVRAAASRGIPQLEHDIIIDDLTFKLAWLRKRTSAGVDKLAVIKVWGDSMEPSLSEGDDVLVDLTQREPSGGGVFLIRDDGALLIKRLQKVGGRLRVLSDNPAYEPYESDKVEVLGRMIWQGRNW